MARRSFGEGGDHAALRQAASGGPPAPEARGARVGLTTAGALYYATQPPAWQSDLKLMSVDFSEGRVLSMPIVAVHEHVGTNDSPRWSHDGKRWAYLSRRPAGALVLVIRSTDDNRIIHAAVASALSRRTRGASAVRATRAARVA